MSSVGVRNVNRALTGEGATTIDAESAELAEVLFKVSFLRALRVRRCTSSVG